MRKKIIIIITIVILGIFAGIFLKSNYLILPGKFISPYNKGNKIGFVIYSPKKVINNYEYILDNNYYNLLQFNKDKSKALAVKSIINPNANDYTIFEIDLTTQQSNPMVKCKFDTERKDEGNTVCFNNVKYVPNKNAISYKWNNNLYIYNLNHLNETLLLSFDGKYDWNQDGNSFIYSNLNENKIYRYNINTKKDEYLFDGYSPVMSNNYDLIAYMNSPRPKSDLVIRNIKSNEQWTYKFINEHIYDYIFSPDSNYIAIIQDNNDLFMPTGWKKIKVFDFKNNKVLDISSKNISHNNFDWK